MGRFLFVIGLIMTIVGFVMPFLSMNNLFGDMGFGGMMELATDSDAREAELCEEGETLEEEHGSSSYTMGQGYGRTVTMFCVDDKGNRREVTGDFLNSMFSEDTFGGIGDMIGQTFLWVGLSSLGIVFMVIGSIMSAFSKRKGMMVMNPYNASFNIPPMQPMNPPMNQATFGSAMPTQPQQGSLAEQLQQLEQAYKQNLISREEYDKARQNLLDNLK